MPSPIFFLSDFGLTDPYVGQVKAVLAGLAPQACVIDLSHGVRAFSVRQGAFFLAASLDSLPKPSVVLAVVDPGVGSQRRLVAVDFGDFIAVAPDNGLLALCMERKKALRAAVIDVTSSASTTFHGRDVLASAAALASAKGFCFDSCIDPDSLCRPAWARPTLCGPRLTASVLSVDRYGNLALNLPQDPWATRLAGADSLVLLTPRPCPVPLVSHYAALPAGQPGLVSGSQGVLELALREQNAALALALDLGDDIILEIL